MSTHLWFVLLAGLLLLQAPPEVSGEVTLTLDVSAMLETQQIFPSTVNDAVWTISPEPGRRLVLLPIQITPGDEPFELGRPEIMLRGGRFLCWQILPEDDKDSQQREEQDNSFRVDSRRTFGGGDFDLGGARGPAPAPGSAPGNFPGNDPARSAIGAANELINGIPAGAPRLTRKITITPDGKVVWALDRAIPSTEEPTSATEPYVLKIYPNLLRDLEPKHAARAVRPSRNDPTTPRTTPTRSTRQPRQPHQPRQPRDATGANNAKEKARKRRENDAAYRVEMKAYRELHEQVRALPVEFEQPLTDHVWAVFDVPAEHDQLTVIGPAPLPWKIELDAIEDLAAVASRQVGGAELDIETQTMVWQMIDLARDQHPLTDRLLATVLVRSQIVARASRGDGLYRMIENLIASSDSQTRRIIIAGLADVIPPTLASLTLLKDAATSIAPDLQLISLRGLMTGDLAKPQEVSAMIAAARSVLMNLQGPNAGEALAAVAEKVGDNPEAIAAFASGINFAELPATRLDQAIVYILQTAPTQPMSAAWLNRGLLGAFEARVPKRTLEVIMEADQGPTILGPVAQSLTQFVFGPPTQAAARSRLELTEPIAIHNTSHALLGLLQSGDLEMRDLAWRSLRAFRAGDASESQASRQPGAASGSASGVIDRVMRAALDQPRTPSTVSPFLAKQKNQPRTTAALVQLVVFGDEASSRQAARALLGSHRTIDAALTEFLSVERWQFAKRLYENIEGEAMPVVGLMRLPGPSTARWLGQAVAFGELPRPNQWAEPFHDQAVLVRLAGDADVELANGAIAALVFSVGGDRFAADDYVQRFMALTDRTEVGLNQAWDSARQDIFAQRLVDAAGTYVLVLTVYPQNSANGQPFGGAIPVGPGGRPIIGPTGMGTPGTPGSAGTSSAVMMEMTHYTLATVELIADGTAVRFRHATVTLTIPTDLFAIRIDNPGDLKNFDVDEIEDVDLQSITDPVDLLPQSDGSWKGQGMMRDGQRIEMILQPADDF